jgi:uncharacterized damage-inducible protein DinB
MNQATIHGALSAMQEYLERSTRPLEEADSSFAPKEGMFTTAGQMAHIAQTVEWFFDGAFSAGGFSMEWEKMDAQVRGCQSLTEARAWMARAFGAAHAAADGHTEAEWASPLPAGPIMGGLPRHSVVSALMDHTAHHRGALTVYARLLGKVSPMPYMDA